MKKSHQEEKGRDPRFHYMEGEDERIDIPGAVRAHVEKRKTSPGGNWPKYKRENWKKLTVSGQKAPQKAQPSAEKKKEENKEKKANWKKWLAVGTAIAIGGVVAKCTIDSNSICRNVDRALSKGYTLSDLGIDERIYERLKKIGLDVMGKKSVREYAGKTAGDIAEVGIDAIVSKIAHPYEGDSHEGENIFLRYGKISPEGEDESYIYIDGEIYARGKGENRHQADDKLIDCIDVIVDIQGVQDYINSGEYNYDKDSVEIHKKYEDALRTINETAATLVRFNENGDIEVEIIRDEKKGTKSADSKQQDEEYEIGD